MRLGQGLGCKVLTLGNTSVASAFLPDLPHEYIKGLTP
jgi:hypothetical protein